MHAILATGLRSYADQEISDAEFAKRAERFPVETPENKEYYLLRKLFEEHYCKREATKHNSIAVVPSGKSIACSTPEAVSWHAAWQQGPSDISGRAVSGVHVAADDFNRQ